MSRSSKLHYILITLFHSYSPRNETLAVSEAEQKIKDLILDIVNKCEQDDEPYIDSLKFRIEIEAL